MTFYIESVYIGIIAYVYSVILTDEGMIFNKPFVYLQDRLPQWLFKPIIGCFYCVAGQISLWYFIYQYGASYNVFSHLLFITSSILTTEIIYQTINKLNK